MTPAAFRKLVWHHYRTHGRHTLPWRPPSLKLRKDGFLDSYRILVSEVMLQQTQVDRVVPKYQSFLKKFPTFKALADTSLQSVLVEWKGLGYNRRALGLKRTAEAVVHNHGGKLPRDYASLLALPGIGPYTAHAVRAFVWNEPDIFVETNIRTVYIHHFFSKATRRQGNNKISDAELVPLVEKTLDTKNPREWYYALMDYGAHLKKTVGNVSRKSASYAKQSTFKGSHRELRAQVLHAIAEKRSTTVHNIATTIKRSETDVEQVVCELKRDGFIKENKHSVRVV